MKTHTHTYFHVQNSVLDYTALEGREREKIHRKNHMHPEYLTTHVTAAQNFRFPKFVVQGSVDDDTNTFGNISTRYIALDGRTREKDSQNNHMHSEYLTTHVPTAQNFKLS